MSQSTWRDQPAFEMFALKPHSEHRWNWNAKKKSFSFPSHISKPQHVEIDFYRWYVNMLLGKFDTYLIKRHCYTRTSYKYEDYSRECTYVCCMYHSFTYPCTDCTYRKVGGMWINVDIKNPAHIWIVIPDQHVGTNVHTYRYYLYTDIVGTVSD